MRVLLLLRGSAGCGKSTWIEQHGLKQYALSADDIRMMCSSPQMMPDGTHAISQANDNIVWKTLFNILETRMKNGEFTVIDATNSKTSEMNRYKKMCDEYRYRIYCVDMTTVPIEVTKERNRGRQELKRVPEEVIDKMYARFETQKIPSGIKVIQPDELNAVFMKKFNLDQYKRMFTVIVVIVLAVIILFGTVFGKQLRVKMKGRTDEVMRQDAQTPEGARDYYNAAIREKEDFYNRASASFAEISGKRSAAENDLHKTRKEIMKVTNDMNACIDSDREDEAMQYARKKSTLESKINVLKDTVDEMKEVEAHQKEIMQQAAEELQKLKEEKEQVVFQMEADSQIIELHQSMDSLSMNNESDRMLERVREGARKTRERADGSRIAYDSSAQAADRRLEASERERNARQILEEARRQRGK